MNGINIIPFRNCRYSNVPDNETIIKENYTECDKYGTCYGLIKLLGEWENVIDGPLYEYEGKKANGINMLSQLACVRGGIIHPVDSGQGMGEGLGQPAITTDWLRLYSYPTVSSSGRPVARHPNANQLDWGMPEELKGDVADNLLPARARAITGLTPIKMSNNGYMDDEGRYWVAVGPNVMNPDYSNTSKVTDKDMMYGTKIDIHVVEQHDSNKHYYIPAVVGDVKNHTHPDGLYQTGIELATHNFESDNADGSTVEFIGYEILNKSGVYDPAHKNSSITLTNDYRLIEILVYDGELNFNPPE